MLRCFESRVCRLGRAGEGQVEAWSVLESGLACGVGANRLLLREEVGRSGG